MSWQLPADQYLDLPNVSPSENLCAWGHLILGSVDTYLSNPERWRDEDYDDVQTAIDDLLAVLADRICEANMQAVKIARISRRDSEGSSSGKQPTGWNAIRWTHIDYDYGGVIGYIATNGWLALANSGLHRVFVGMAGFRTSFTRIAMKNATSPGSGGQDVAQVSGTINQGDGYGASAYQGIIDVQPVGAGNVRWLHINHYFTSNTGSNNYGQASNAGTDETWAYAIIEYLGPTP